MNLSNAKSNKSLFLATLIMIIVSDDTLFFGTNANSQFVSIKYGILLTTLGILFFSGAGRMNSRTAVHTSAVLCVGMCVLVLITGVINSDLRTGYFYKCAIFMLSCLFVQKFSFEEFAHVFEKIMFFFAVTSAFCTGLATINRNIFSFFPIFYNSANVGFYNLLICMIPVTGETIRNYSIFREPGVYQMFLMLGLIFHTYYGENFKIYKLIIYLIALVLTYSTTGYFVLIIYMVLYLVKRNHTFSQSKKKYVALFLMIAGVIFLSLKTDLLSSEGVVFDKLDNMKRETTIARFASVSVNIDMWLEKPIFGNGLISVEERFPQLCLLRYGFASPHNTNTLFNELATYGLLYTLIFTIGFIKLTKRFSERKIEQVMIGLIFLVLLFGEKLTFSPIIYILMFYGLSNKNSFRVMKEV